MPLPQGRTESLSWRLWKKNSPFANSKVAERLVPVGELVTTHGIKGWLKLKPYNPQTTILLSPQEVFLTKGGVSWPHIVQQSRPFKNLFLVKLQGMDEIGAAEKWVGAILSIEEKGLQPLSPGEYFYYQVIGFDVFDTQGEWIGKISRIWAKEGGDLYVVTGSSKEYLIPAVKEIIEKVDLAAGKVIINPPAGLLDL